MSDNTQLNARTTDGDIIATDDVGGAKYQRVKVNFGVDGARVDVSLTDPLPVTTKVPRTPSAPTAVSVGVASGSAVASNANRKGLILTNTSQATISLGFGATAVLESGVTLFPGGIFRMDEYSFALGEVTAIASLASSNLAVQEFE